VAQQKLDLLQLSSVDVAELCASSSLVMGSEVQIPGVWHSFGSHTRQHSQKCLCPRCPVSTHRPEYSSSRDRPSCHPSVNCAFHSDRHGHGLNMFAFTDKVSNCPMPLSDLNVLPLSADNLARQRPSQARWRSWRRLGCCVSPPRRLLQGAI